MNLSKDPVEAIILAGGSGSRLRSVSGDLPKPMMPLCGRPFLSYLLQNLLNAGIQRIVLSVGHRHEVISSYFGNDYKGISIAYCVDEIPLGTGGALTKALRLTSEQNLLVLNGDSYYGIDMAAVFRYHTELHGDVTIALKQLDECSRFGTVSVQDDRIVSFREKGVSGSGYINSGIYVVNRRIVKAMPVGETFSFETDVLEKIVTTKLVLPYFSNAYFIDIGTPDDYRRAELDFKGMFGASK